MRQSGHSIARPALLCALGLLVLSSLPAHGQQDPLARAAAEAGAVVTDSGLVYRSLQDGKGASPSATDTVSVHYRGSFALNRVIRCWTEGVQRMKVGGKARLTCPAALAYGARGAGDVIPPNAVLNFEVELLAIAGQ